MIQLDGVSKRFDLYNQPLDRLLHWCGFANRSKAFWALRNITLAVPPGKTTGLVGVNGSGKSTLLKLISGTLLPTTGSLNVQGRVAALLELGTGFHSEFTGRQNIWINGQILGLTQEEIAEKQEAIIAFSELGDFIDQPLRTYSSGMIVRLGFSVAAAVEPDVLIIDEALSVGDAHFSQKCLKRIRQFKESGATVLFVSHDPNAVTSLCDEAVLLSEGKVQDIGLPKDILEHYGVLLAAQGQANREMVFQRDQKRSPSEARKSGSFEALITEVRLLNPEGQETDLFFLGKTFSIEMTVVFLADVQNPTAGIMIRDEYGTDVFGTNTALLGIDLGNRKESDQLTFRIQLPVQFGEGKYTLTTAIHDSETHLEKCFDWTDRAALFSVRSAGKRVSTGRLYMESAWEVVESHLNEQKLSENLEQQFSHQPNPLPLFGVHPSPFIHGFYKMEQGEMFAYRWAEKSATLVLHISGTHLKIKTFFPEAFTPEWKVRLSIEGHSIGEIHPTTYLQETIVQLPKQFIGKTARVNFEAMHALVEGEAREQRELAFALAHCETLNPAKAPEA